MSNPYKLELDSAQNIFLTAHASVDADAVGSLAAMASVLMRRGKTVTVFIYGRMLPEASFMLEGLNVIDTLTQPLSTYDKVIVLDCGDIKIAHLPELMEPGLALINIDHHATNPRYGSVTIVEPEASSTTEILHAVFKANGWDITPAEATALLAGILGDTGLFKHSNTTAQTMSVAGELLASGASLSKLIKAFFTRTPQQLRALSLALNNAYLDTENRAIISGVTQPERDALELEEGSFPGAVDLLNTCSEARYASFLKQKDEYVSVSLRSEEHKEFDVSELAKQFGGGGHKYAAAFRVKGTLEHTEEGFLVRPTTSE